DLPETSRNNSIEIYDMGMKLIDKFNIDQLGKSFTKQYDIATGNYFYVLRSGSRVMKTGKFIISR
ncbi:MAG TPA: T9SS type A sorting domain-containing protein, partial [Flavobacterium sp.]|nr:T9SS type A sorting domain-containing protein [Flavobacterium sp.]